jgi:hypothetical protein
MTYVPVYSEFIDFLAAGFTPQQLIDYKPSPTFQQSFSSLLHRSKNGTLTEQEQADLDHCLQLEHIIRLAKARVKQHL